MENNFNYYLEFLLYVQKFLLAYYLIITEAKQCTNMKA